MLILGGTIGIYERNGDGSNSNCRCWPIFICAWGLYDMHGNVYESVEIYDPETDPMVLRTLRYLKPGRSC